MSSAEHDKTWHTQDDASELDMAQSLSALMDGEGNIEGFELDADGARQRWAVYHLISDALREPSAAVPVSAQFAARMSAALAREGVHGQQAVRFKPKREPVSRWRQAVLAWPGVAMAAAVVSVVWVAQPLFGLEQGDQQVMSVVQTEPVGAAPSVIEQLRPASDYVSAHRQLAGPIAVRQVAFTPGAD